MVLEDGDPEFEGEVVVLACVDGLPSDDVEAGCVELLELAPLTGELVPFVLDPVAEDGEPEDAFAGTVLFAAVDGSLA